MSGNIIGGGGTAGPKGDTGSAGAAGANAFTTQAATFTAPAIASTVSIQVASSAWMAVDMIVYVATAGYYKVTAKADGTHFTGRNLGYTGNAAPTTSITGANLITAGGLIGVTGAAGVDGAPGLLVQSERDGLTVDASAIPVASGWVDVLAVMIVTADDTSILEASAVLLGTVAVGAQGRLVLDGGSYTNAVIALGSFPVALAQLSLALLSTRALDAADTYTLTLQAQGNGVVATITPLANTTILAHVLSV